MPEILDKTKQKMRAVLEEEAEKAAFVKKSELTPMLAGILKGIKEIKPSLTRYIDAKFISSTATLAKTEARMRQFITDAKALRDKEMGKHMKRMEGMHHDLRSELNERPTLDDVIGFVDRALENQPPESAESIRDSLETLEGEERLSIEALDGWEKFKEQIMKIASKPSGGASPMDVSHWPRHEEFTMNGSDTTVTLTQAVACAGDAIFAVRYQGQVLDKATHYTVDGNKISLVGFTPEADTIISVSYLP